MRLAGSLTWKMINLALILTTGAGLALAAGNRSDAEVKVEATATKLDSAGKQTVTVTLAINKGWHIYANPVNNDEIATAKTVVTINAKVKPTEVKITYPTGKVHVDKSIGNYMTYEDKATIQADILRAAGDTSPLEVSVRFMACNDKTCLMPATVKRALP